MSDVRSNDDYLREVIEPDAYLAECWRRWQFAPFHARPAYSPGTSRDLMLAEFIEELMTG